MTLFIEDGAPVIVQGMTGHQGMTHTARMLKAGTNIVGGVNARKAGQEVNFPEAKTAKTLLYVFLVAVPKLLKLPVRKQVLCSSRRVLLRMPWSRPLKPVSS